MLKAVRDTGSALQYASQRLQNDPEAWETQRFLDKNERENDRCLVVSMGCGGMPIIKPLYNSGKFEWNLYFY